MAQTFNTNFTYDVFLSFRGDDTRYQFARNLYEAFRRKGIDTFFDDEKLRGGDELSPSLSTAIEESRMFVIVFSENYASSTWCLRELADILQCAEKNNRRVWPIFYKVDPSDIRHQRNSYGDVMTRHEEKFGKDSERVSNWRFALTKVANLKGDHFRITGNEYEYDFIERIVKKISTGLLPKDLDVGEHVVGLELRVKEVISLLDISSQDTVCRLGIHGIGGIGKTMLAKALYNLIAHQFKYASFLSNVRETSNEPGGMVRLQNTLLFEMLEEDIKISSVDRGVNIIKNRLCNKRVLLVLDDIDHKEQLEMLVGECNWFGSGSKIIVTTRDKHLLYASRFEKKYEMRELNYCEALELFSWKAFASSQPPKEFVNLSLNVVKYASGLPLVLRVIGSNLFGKSLDECICALNQYKRIPNKRIQDILRISYDGLEENQKEIFLDIACFFKGYYLQDIINAWEACDLGPKYHIGVLVDKSLITTSEYWPIGMHDLIQDMCKEVVRQITPKEIGQRSRLWRSDEVVKVLEENSGTYEVEGIKLESPQQTIQWKGTAFKKMKNLRILIVKNAYFSIGPKYLPNSLRVLEWSEYPLTSLPSNFDPKNLVVWQMTKSSIKLQKSFKNFKYLSVMNFSYCQSIIEVPDMSGALILRRIHFSHCKNLVKVHDSIGFLPKVRVLDIAFCENLTSLPSTMQMASLQLLHISGCTSLEHFPNILGNMDCLTEIFANNTAIKELPNSFGNLTSLEYLHMSGCKNLQEIYGIPSNLRQIKAADCTSLSQQSHNVLWSQVIKKSSRTKISMPGAQIPDWFDHRCKGRVLSFWARKKLPNATCAFIDNWGGRGNLYRCRLFINNVEVRNYLLCGWRPAYFESSGRYVYLYNLEDALGKNGLKDVEKYLLEWNYVEVEMEGSFESFDCGIYVDKEGTRMEDVRFECPYITLPIELVLRNSLKRRAAFHSEDEPPKKLLKKLRNASKRGAAFHSENEPPKKLLKKHKPRDNREKYQNPRTKKRKIHSVKKGDRILPQNQHKDFPWEMLWNLHLPPKVIIFLWKLCNCILPTYDILNSGHVQVRQTCSLCGVKIETSQHIFMQCTFARALWFGSQLSIRLDNFDIVLLIKLSLQDHINAEVHREFICSVALILYTIWSFRNKAIFNGETPSSKVALKVWFGLYQKYVATCPVIEQTNRADIGSNSVAILKSPPFYAFSKTYLSVYRVRKFTCKITYCQAFMIDDRVLSPEKDRVWQGFFLMSGAATKFQVLFQGLKILLEDAHYFRPYMSIYMPSSSCIEMLNEPSMAPAHLQTIVKDVKRLLMPFPFNWVSYGLFPHSSPESVKSRRWGSVGKWEWRNFYM